MAVFVRRANWFLTNRTGFANTLASVEMHDGGQRCLMALLTKERLQRMLRYMLDETEFLSAHGIRSLSKVHQEPYVFHADGQSFAINYTPAESQSGLFGGNSNWRGPIWFPINYLLLESLQHFHRFYGDDLTVEFPTGSGRMLTLDKVADNISQGLVSIFQRNGAGKRPVYGGLRPFQEDPHWRDYILFHEYFHGDNGAGLGASHQTGWTGLVTSFNCITKSTDQRFPLVSAGTPICDSPACRSSTGLTTRRRQHRRSRQKSDDLPGSSGSTG
jgi:hypothetical protein